MTALQTTRGASTFRAAAIGAAVGVALGASLLAQAQPAEARLALGSPAVTLLISRTAETAVSFTTRPSASCLVGAGAAAPMPLTADLAGTVRFYARTSPAAPPAIPLTAACSAGSLQWIIPLEVRSVAGIVHNRIPPPVADPSFRLPLGFDPAAASDAEVARLGFPHRPDRLASPELYGAWLHVLQSGVRVAPGGVAIPGEYSQGPQSVIEGDVRGTKTLGTANWSGILANGTAGQYDNVEGSWHVPSVSAPLADLPASSLMWVGIDGADKAKGLFQTGTAQDVYYKSGVIMTKYYAWYEIVPGYPVTVFKNFVVKPGDEVDAETDNCSTSQGSFIACFYLIDVTQDESTSDALDTNGTVTMGCAEWIMERPTTKYGLPALPDYGQVVASSMEVYDTFLGAWTKYGDESHNRIYMYNYKSSGGKDLLSTAGGTANLEGAVYDWVNYL